ncbi:hypothetical protein [Methylorubrum populi]|uniref:hypothetical protein n=1 Tax=Methylorubrum populi TaxID=223967 RepID=UPI000DB6C4D7|nr:hypothetical protein [Methylorubrum populi]PZP66244.1 MAG: hypothetical protein DI590_24640 [Methylorubrum populi]
MSAAAYAFRPILRGDTGALSFYLRRVEIITKQRFAYDLADHDIELTLRPPGGPDRVYRREDLTMEDEAGGITLPLSASTTAALPTGSTAYRLRITDTDSRVMTVLTGSVPLVDWPMSTPLPLRSASPASDAIGLDAPFEVVEVVVPFNEGTVAEAVRQAKEVVSQLTLDDIEGLRDAITLATVNNLDRRVLELSGDPAPADIPGGTIRVCKNTATGRSSLWLNDGGTVVDLLTFAPVT